jgi:hypothetical protein
LLCTCSAKNPFIRTHRERKEAYTKSLEQEVIQLRANEAKILQETRDLYTELTALKKLMAQHGIQMPITHTQGQHESALSSASSSEEVFNLSIQVTSTKQKRRQIRVYKQSEHGGGHPSASSTGSQSQAQSASNDSSTLSPNCTSYQTPSRVALYQTNEPKAFFSPTSSKELALRSPLHTRVCEMDLTTVGMNFILTYVDAVLPLTYHSSSPNLPDSLESPCLSHITDAPPDAPMGHALMASATLLHHQSHRHDHHHHQNQTHQSHEHHNQSQPTWQIHTSGIDRLLQLSYSIPISDDELTPVQAWDLLRKRSDFGALEVERLKVLEETLIKSVKCYG